MHLGRDVAEFITNQPALSLTRPRSDFPIALIVAATFFVTKKSRRKSLSITKQVTVPVTLPVSSVVGTVNIVVYLEL
jgi:hypothetical protein